MVGMLLLSDRWSLIDAVCGPERNHEGFFKEIYDRFNTKGRNLAQSYDMTHVDNCMGLIESDVHSGLFCRVKVRYIIRNMDKYLLLSSLRYRSGQ
jgi:hypothetical protein